MALLLQGLVAALPFSYIFGTSRDCIVEGL